MCTQLILRSSKVFVATVAIVSSFLIADAAFAATLSISPSTGVYQSGSTFTARVVVNTQGDPINAADGALKFNPQELSVVSVNRSSSIFNLWVTEPAFSNSAGSISFSGGLPSGYTGSNGTIMNITFRAIGSGAAKVNFTSGSVLANDGRGSNVLTSMNGGTFTLQAASAAPEPEEIEYVAPANTPGAPVVRSSTHSDPSKWYASNSAELAWDLPTGVTSVRTLLDSNPTTVPTKVYEEPISNISLSDLDEGVSYFHVQFRNADGWGRVTHYRLAVDTKKPEALTIALKEGSDLSNPIQTLQFDIEEDEDSSPVSRYMIKLNTSEPYEYIDETGSSTHTLAALEPGYHSVIVEAFDAAGNSIIGTFSFTIAAFDKPTFTEYPNEINQQVIPVIKGLTRPSAEVTITLQKIGSEVSEYNITADASGNFTFIPEGRFTEGVYELTAVSKDQYGAMSEPSEKIRIAVQQSGFVRVGSFVVSVLSIIVPLIALLVLSVLGFWYLLAYLRRFRRTVGRESKEALDILHREFTNLQTILRNQETSLQEARKTKKLTKAESDMIEAFDKALQTSQRAVEKEIADVTKLSKSK